MLAAAASKFLNCHVLQAPARCVTEKRDIGRDQVDNESADAS